MGGSVGDGSYIGLEGGVMPNEATISLENNRWLFILILDEKENAINPRQRT